jgi:hypothetical protein
MLKNLMIFYEKALIAYNNTENKNKREIWLNENEKEELNNMINTLIVFYEKALKYYYSQ